MAQIMIGGVARTTAPMNFVAWKIAWSHFETVRTGQSKELDAVGEMLAFIACAVAMAEPGAEEQTAQALRARVADVAAELERKLKVSEIAGLKDGVQAIMAENGFATGAATGEGPGEDMGAPANATTTPSTATSTASSAASSSA